MKRFLFIIRRSSIDNFPNLFIFAVFLLIFTCSTPLSAKAQEENNLKDTAPPPLKIVSKEEARQLDAETDIKKRTKLALDLMEIRLKNAEGFNAQQKFAEMFNELGAFHALVDKTLDYLDSKDNGGGKVLNNFKRVEMTLRGFLPRLEIIRRDLPERFEPYVRDLAKAVRQARGRAVDPLFSDTVVKDN